MSYLEAKQNQSKARAELEKTVASFEEDRATIYDVRRAEARLKIASADYGEAESKLDWQCQR